MEYILSSDQHMFKNNCLRYMISYTIDIVTFNGDK